MDGEKAKTAGSSVASTLGGLYALLITVLGVVFPVIFFVDGSGQDNGLYLTVFHIYIYTVSLFFLLYLQCCLMTKRRKKSSYMDDRTDSMDFDAIVEPKLSGDHTPTPGEGAEEENGNYPIEDTNPLDKEEKDDNPPFSYTADGVNFFLRFGIIVFGMGCVVLDGFRLLQFVETSSTWLCYGNFFLAQTALGLVFIFAETFFIFKNHKLVVNFKKPFVKFGLVHMIATNLCIWAMTIAMETSEYFNLLKIGDSTSYTPGTPEVVPTQMEGAAVNGPLFMNVSHNVFKVCHEQRTLADKSATYLYPCKIQFCIIAAAALCRIFTNVGGATWIFPRMASDRHRGICHKANSGLFLGLIIVVVTCIATCFFLLYKRGESPLEGFITSLVFFCNDISVLALATIIVLVAFCKVTKLAAGKLEDRFNQNLVFVGIAGYYAFYVCILVPCIAVVNAEGHSGLSAKLFVVVCLLAMVQATAQVTLIVDSLRRHSTTRRHLKIKPGRSFITFLLIINLALWIIDAFELQELHSTPSMNNFYGRVAWQILIHILLPVAVLFRFHSAVCFADIWANAYKKRPNANMSFLETDSVGNHPTLQVQHVG